MFCFQFHCGTRFYFRVKANPLSLLHAKIQKAFIVENSRKGPPLVSRFYNCPLFLTSCKGPLDSWSTLYVHCMYSDKLRRLLK